MEQKPTPKPTSSGKKRKKKKGLKRQQIVLIVVAGVIVLLLIVLFAVLPLLQASMQPSEESSSSSVVSTAKVLLSKTKAEVDTVSLTPSGDESSAYVLKRMGNGSFDIPLLKGYTLLQDDIDKAAGTLCNVRASETVSDAPENPADYGLDKPTLRADYAFADGTTFALEFGAQVPGTAYYYVRVAGEQPVYVLTSVSTFFAPVTQYVGLTVLDRPEALYGSGTTWSTSELFSEVTLTGTGLDNDILIKPADKSGMTSVMAGTYSYTIEAGPYSTLLNPARMTEGLCESAFFGLEAESVAAIAPDAADIARFGLDEPYKVVNATILGIQYTMSCSEKTGDGYYYVMRKGYNVVFKVPADTLVWAEYDYFNMATSLVYTPEINSVAEVDLDFGDGARHALTTNCPEMSDDLQVVYNGEQQIDPKQYRQFYSLIIYATTDAPLTGEEDLSADPLLTMTFHEQNGTVGVIRLIPISARSVAIEYNGQAQYYMRAEYVDKIARELDNLLNGREVSATW